MKVRLQPAPPPAAEKTDFPPALAFAFCISADNHQGFYSFERCVSYTTHSPYGQSIFSALILALTTALVSSFGGDRWPLFAMRRVFRIDWVLRLFSQPSLSGIYQKNVR